MIWRGRGFARGFRDSNTSPTEFLILVSLQQKNRHGYDIIKALEEQFSGIWTPKPGTIYPTLSRLERRGLIEQITQTDEDTTTRKLYRITDSGKQVLSRATEGFDREIDFFDNIVDFVNPLSHKMTQRTFRSIDRLIKRSLNSITKAVEMSMRVLSSEEASEILKEINESLEQKREEIKQRLDDLPQTEFHRIDIE